MSLQALPQADLRGDPGMILEDLLHERWSRIFGPVVKVDWMTKEVIPNDKTKEPFARFQSQGCA